MNDREGFGLIGFLLAYILGVAMGGDPLLGAIVMAITYVALMGIAPE